MSRERRVRVNQVKVAVSSEPLSCSRRKTVILALTTLVAGAIISFAVSQHLHRGLVPPSVQRVSTVHAGLTLGRLMEMTPDNLASVDIAEANLVCARGLPGSENLDVAAKLKQLDTWADHVYSETQRNWHRFKENPAEYQNSAIYFRMGMLVTVLQQDFGVRYNPDLIDVPESNVDKAFLSDPSNMLLTGLLSDKRMGTCSSMPVLYTAVARRLGYPVTLVSAKDHLFVRWQDSSNADGHQNIEGTSRGLVMHNDEYYKNWRALTPEELKSGVHMKSLTPGQELSVFLMTRGAALVYHRRLLEAAVAYAHACALWPENRDMETSLEAVGVKLASWQFHETPPGSVLRAPHSFNPGQGIEQSNYSLLRQTHPEIDWNLVYQKKFDRTAP